MSIDDPHSRAALRWGWSLLALFLLGGLLLEFLHLVKAPWYLEVRIRRELWVLAHAHGALMALLCIAFAHSAMACLREERKRALASLTLRAGAVLLPTGFFLGGIGNSESDPSLFIIATPAGALLVLHAVSSMALGAFSERRGSEADQETVRRTVSPPNAASSDRDVKNSKTPLPEAAGPVKPTRRKN